MLGILTSALLRRRAKTLLAPRTSASLQTVTLDTVLVFYRGGDGGERGNGEIIVRPCSSASSSASSPSLSIWRRKKEMGKEGLFVVHELKRLSMNGGPRMESFMRTSVSRLVRTDLLAVLAELQRQDLVLLSMKIYDMVRQEIWYRPDMYFYRDMIMMLARNKKMEESKQVWTDLKNEEVQFDQHTYGDIVRAFLDSGLPDMAMEFYDEMRLSSDRPLFLPFRVMLKGFIPYPELREKVKDDFLELFPHTSVYDPPEDLFEETK